jgi:hypothetical protein
LEIEDEGVRIICPAEILANLWRVYGGFGTIKACFMSLLAPLKRKEILIIGDKLYYNAHFQVV